MPNIDAETIWRMPKKEVVSLIEERNFPNRTGKIRFYAPTFAYYKSKHFRSAPNAFPSISITGSSCALKCKHCNGKVLDTMAPARNPEELFDVCAKLKKNGAVGCLISGGCFPDGSVPIGKFVDAIAQIKKKLGLTVIVHTGITDFSTAKRLKTAGVDAALIDIIGSDETIREVYRLDVSVADYERSLSAFHQVRIPFVPHVLVGLHYGELKGELEALKMISRHSPSAVITIAFMPIRGTPMEKVTPPEPEDIARILVSSRLLMPETPIALGCMRPKGEHRKRTDLLAVRAGVDGIAFPVEEAIRLAESMNLEASFSPLCCSQIFEDLNRGSL
ncbi:MAG TPA: radical SAM protein [Candidatus Bathyarchaeota archaeon]|nr:radical SAM protein [Candidatus Bathyarchaeota archaeon]